MTVIDFIYKQKGKQHELLLLLHNFITGYDNIQASIKYGIPFYSLTKPICYLNPQKKGGVELVFWNAAKMKKSLPILDMKNRKWMAGITYTDISNLDFELLDEIIQESISADPSIGIKKSSK